MKLFLREPLGIHIKRPAPEIILVCFYDATGQNAGVFTLMLHKKPTKCLLKLQYHTIRKLQINLVLFMAKKFKFEVPKHLTLRPKASLTFAQLG